jgi:hypothetical protein
VDITTDVGATGAGPARWTRPPLGPRTLTILFCVANLILVGIPVGRALAGYGLHKDYQLWYGVGRLVLSGGDLYSADASGRFFFLYPPFAALLLAPLSLGGRVFAVACVCLTTVVGWWAAARLSDRLSGLVGPKPWWVAALPSIVSLPFIWDMFDLGQPNLMLLAIMLAGLFLLQGGRQGSAGAMFGMAAALKAFPIAILPYLIWRRRWVSAGSMILVTVACLFLVPAPFRGFERNLAEVKTWAQGMVFSASQKGFGQRPEQNWSWKNDSLIAVTHRFVRPVNAEAEDPKAPPLYVNVLNLSYDQANWVVLGLAGLLGLGFVAAMPAERRRTPASDAAEFAILIALMTIASPLARAYYFVWLLFPFTLLIYRAALDPERKVRRIAGGAMAASLVLFTLGAGAVKPHLLPALGAMLWATLVVIAALAWLMRRSAKPAEPPAPAGA